MSFINNRFTQLYLINALFHSFRKQEMNERFVCVSPQFDLVCADGWFVDMYQATLNVGFLIGSITIGYLADR